MSTAFAINKTTPPAFWRGRNLICKIGFHKHLKQLVTVDVTYQTSSVVEGCDVCRILGKDISDKLIDRIIALLLKCVVYCGEYLFHFVFSVVVHRECHGLIDHIYQILLVRRRGEYAGCGSTKAYSACYA